jgi:hypothetical protein
VIDPTSPQKRDQRLPVVRAELRSKFVALVFPQSEPGAATRKSFDEYLPANEFGLALETPCDFLFECDESTIEPRILAAISGLHSKMGVEDNCVSLLRHEGAMPG